MLQASPDHLRHAANRFSSGAQELRRKANQYQGASTQLLQGPRGWYGTGAQAFARSCQAGQEDLLKTSAALERIAAVLQMLASRMEHVNQLRAEASNVENSIMWYSAETPEERHTINRMRQRAQELRYAAEMEAMAADQQAATAFQEIQVIEPRQMDADPDDESVPEAWRGRYLRDKRFYDEQDSTVNAPLTMGAYKRFDYESSAAYLQKTDRTLLDQIYGWMAGGVDGTKEFFGNVISSVEHPVETLASIRYAITHPDEMVDALKEMGHQVKRNWDSGNTYGLGKTITEGVWGVFGIKGTGLSEDAANATGNALKSGFGKWNSLRHSVTLSDGTTIRVPEHVVRSNEELAAYMEARIRNEHLAGEVHPVTGVSFDAQGFPIFDAKFEMQLEPADYLKSRDNHFRTANKLLFQEVQMNPTLQFTLNLTKDEVTKLEYGFTPNGYTWHHHQEPGRLQLVDREIHKKTGHTGGFDLWGQGSQK